MTTETQDSWMYIVIAAVIVCVAAAAWFYS